MEIPTTARVRAGLRLAGAVSSLGTCRGAVMSKLTPTQVIRIADLPLFRSSLPYLIQRSGDGWLMLGRDYKPIGVTARDWVDYDDFAHQRFKLRVHPLKMQGVWRPKDRDGQHDCRWWFYSDSVESYMDYFQRLERFYTYVKA